MPRPLPRDHILSLEPYALAARDAASPRQIRLDQNENATPPAPETLEAARAALAEANRYPDADAGPLREAIAAAEGLPAARILCGAGSMELLGLIGQAYLRPGDEALISQHGYLYFRSVAQANGASVVLAPERGFSADVDALLGRVSPRTRILFLANPNNPTGSLLGRGELERLRAGLRDDVILVLDGAYAEYVEDGAYDPGAFLVDRAPNTVMLRSFSKIHGLAGLRVGWGYFPTEIAAILHRIRHPNAIGAPGIAAAAAAIGNLEHVAVMRRANAALRDWLFQELRSQGFDPCPSHGNFLLLPFETRGKASAAYDHLRGAGILVRPLAGYGLRHCLRITIGSWVEVRSLIQALAAWPGRS